MIYLREVRPEDLRHIALNMRVWDKVELRALNGVSPIRGLNLSVGCSMFSQVAVSDGAPVAVFGLGEDGLNPYTETGVIWFLGTDAVTAYPREMLTVGRRFVDFGFSVFPVITNLIHSGNAPALRFARHLLKHFKGSLEPEGIGQRLILRRE